MQQQYQWNILPTPPADVVQRFPELEPTTLQLLFNRNITTQEEVDHFLNADYGQDQHDPYLFRDMAKAIERIKQAVAKKEKIVVHGDYDADGVCGSAVMYKTLTAIGGDVTVYLPHRDTEGYGLNMNTVQTLKDTGTQLIITVDCGISNAPEVDKAVELGMEVIVTDHHSQPPVLPTKALAIINPKLDAETYPFKYLAGVGVAFKVCQALIKEYGLGEAFEKWLLDMVAISTVTDFVPLTGENRVFLKYGLVVMRKNNRLGLRKLFEAMGASPEEADAQTIGFKIGPHINAAGRVKHANMAFEMLIEENAEKAEEIAGNLVRTNKERQQLSEKMSQDALRQAELQKEEFVIIVESNDWPVGLVGLVAGKVASTYHRPTFVVTTMGSDIVGSGRSIEHFDLVAALQSMPEVFSKYGGHPMACGFSLKDPASFSEFKERMRARAKELLDGKDLRKVLQIEQELPFTKLNWQLVEILEQCSPYGEGNCEPIFMTPGVTVYDVAAVGKSQSHLRLTVTRDGVKRQCIGFGLGDWAQVLMRDDKIDVVYGVGVNEWNGNREIQLIVKDIRKL